MTTASDYDARRVSDADTSGLSPLGELTQTLHDPATVDEDASGLHFFELPGADQSGEELAVTVIAQRADEFMCSICFLVQHRGRLGLRSSGGLICTDCL